MGVNWRVSAVFAGAAFILSILSGMIAGVGFGLLILRAIIGAAIFAAVGAGVSLLIVRYLPDLQSLFERTPIQTSENQDDQISQSAATGRNVDIVLPADQSMFGDSYEEYDEQDEAEDENQEEYDGDALIEEVEELPSEDEVSGADRARATEAAISDTGESRRHRRNKPVSQPSESLSDDETTEMIETNVDDLPDIGGLASSFEGNPDEIGSPGGFGSSSGEADEGDSRQRSGTASIDPGDPETIARALRTMLKRDQS